MDRAGSASDFLDSLKGRRVHMVGVKGPGMSALAEILCAAGAIVSGSDVPEEFYTDAILKTLPLDLRQGFSADNVGSDIALVIHSAAYNAEGNPELAQASARGLPVMLYTQALGALSECYDSSGISGVHGKTTTTAMCGAILQALGCPATILAGSAVSSFGGKSTLSLGQRFLVAETCEYKRHFLSFRPKRIVLTSVEMDHQDYFRDFADILSAFVEYGRLLPEGGQLIFCADDPGAVDVAGRLAVDRHHILIIPYGFKAAGPFRIGWTRSAMGRTEFALALSDRPFSIQVPGRHLVEDATAALALSCAIMGAMSGRPPGDAPCGQELEDMRRGLQGFRGSKRRSEILGEAGGVLFMDDYGHHPTAISATIAGIREFLPGRRIVLDFMSHTYSRTAALLDEFAAAVVQADRIFLHKIYASARERPDGRFSGRSLYDAVEALRPGAAEYAEEPLDALPQVLRELRQGDIFLTMGAGDNWRLGAAALEAMARGGEQA